MATEGKATRNGPKLGGENSTTESIAKVSELGSMHLVSTGTDQSQTYESSSPNAMAQQRLDADGAAEDQTSEQALQFLPVEFRKFGFIRMTRNLIIPSDTKTVNEHSVCMPAIIVIPMIELRRRGESMVRSNSALNFPLLSEKEITASEPINSLLACPNCNTLRAMVSSLPLDRMYQVVLQLFKRFYFTRLCLSATTTNSIDGLKEIVTSSIDKGEQLSTIKRAIDDYVSMARDPRKSQLMYERNVRPVIRDLYDDIEFTPKDQRDPLIEDLQRISDTNTRHVIQCYFKTFKYLFNYQRRNREFKSQVMNIYATKDSLPDLELTERLASSLGPLLLDIAYKGPEKDKMLKQYACILLVGTNHALFEPGRNLSEISIYSDVEKCHDGCVCLSFRDTRRSSVKVHSSALSDKKPWQLLSRRISFSST